jgi:RNA polymerase sigma-70 factor (ECF subfamily)
VSASILERIAAGDQAAVKECMDQFGGLVWSLARRFSPRREDAEDAVQEIFLSLWKSADRYDPALASEATFVAMLARRRLIDRNRARSVRPQGTDLEAAPEPAARDGAGQVEAAVDVRRAVKLLDTLRPEQKRVVELSVLSGLSHSEIADVTGLALGTVKTHARRGLQRLRAALAGEQAEGEA